MKTNSPFKLVGIAALLILGGLFSTISLEHGQEDINVIATIQADLPGPLKGYRDAPDNRTVNLDPREAWGIYCRDMKKNDVIYWDIEVHGEGELVKIIIFHKKGGEWLERHHTYFGTGKTNTDTYAFDEDGTWIVILYNPSWGESAQITYDIRYVKEKLNEFSPTSRLLIIHFSLIGIFFIGFWCISKITHRQWRFNFLVKKKNPNEMFLESKQALSTTNRLYRIERERPPRSFTYQTFWGLGTLFFKSEQNEGTKIDGNVKRVWKWYIWIGAAFIFLLVYGLMGTSLILPIVMIIGLLLDLTLGNKNRKSFGSRLCEALQGTNFHQQ